jgi:hypothetical protein
MTTGTAADEFILASGTVKLPVGTAGRATPATLTTLRVGGGVVGRYRLGVDETVNGKVSVREFG